MSVCVCEREEERERENTCIFIYFERFLSLQVRDNDICWRAVFEWCGGKMMWWLSSVEDLFSRFLYRALDGEGDECDKRRGGKR